MFKYPIISLCGIDGSGKSSLLHPLSRELEKHYGTPFRTVKYPGGTQIGQAIRTILLGKEGVRAEVIEDNIVRQLLFAADLRATTTEIVLPTLEKGEGVVCDRFIPSSYIYATRGHMVPEEDVLQILDMVIPRGCYEQLGFCNVLLDVSVEVAMKRPRKQDYGDSFDSEYYNRIREGYLARAKEKPERWIVVNAESAPDFILGFVLESVCQNIDTRTSYSNEYKGTLENAL